MSKLNLLPETRARPNAQPTASGPGVGGRAVDDGGERRAPSRLRRQPADGVVVDLTDTAGVLAEATDRDLVDDLIDGRPDALAIIHDRHSAAVRGMARRLCGPDIADDVTQEVFLRLWRRPDAFDETRGNLRAYLLTLTRGRSIDTLRSGTARRAREMATVREPVNDPTVLDGEVWSLLHVLDVKERTAIALAFYAGYSYRAVAQLLNEPEGTIKTRIRGGLLRLRVEMRTGDLPEFRSPGQPGARPDRWVPVHGGDAVEPNVDSGCRPALVGS